MEITSPSGQALPNPGRIQIIIFKLILKQYFKVFLDDCERSGQRFASSKVNVLLTENQKLQTQIAFLNHVGFCNSKGLSDNFEVCYKKKQNTYQE